MFIDSFDENNKSLSQHQLPNCAIIELILKRRKSLLLKLPKYIYMNTRKYLFSVYMTCLGHMFSTPERTESINPAPVKCHRMSAFQSRALLFCGKSCSLFFCVKIEDNAIFEA